MNLDDLLKEMVEKEASDIYLTTGASPSVRIRGKVHPLEYMPLISGEVDTMAQGIMSVDQKNHYAVSPEVNLALSVSGVGRFRVNVFQQRNETAMVIRHIQVNIPSLQTLQIPACLQEVILAHRGLFLVVGATGSGKSTTVASLIDHRNRTASGHIMTIEDPIEFVHRHQQSIVNQREVGVDTESYDMALKSVLRQAPDVIYIGEIRSREAMEHALNYAQTGHLCLSTLHANNANQAIDRIVNFFPKELKNHILFDLSQNLQAVVSQRLIPTKQEHTRVAAFEVLLNTPLVRDLIQDDGLDDLKEAMEKSSTSGMGTFDMALYRLYVDGHISQERALEFADSANNLRIRMATSSGNPLDELDKKNWDFDPHH